VQFVRYVMLVGEQAARCVMRCPRGLAPLLSTVPGVAQISVEDEPLPAYDAHLSLLSLPRVLGTTSDTIPAKVPYIEVPEAKRAVARASLERFGAKRRVGVCWAGNPAHPNDRNRSIPLVELTPLFALSGIEWFSLQAGAGTEQLAATTGVEHVAPLPVGMALIDTAALIAELDLIVSVDTSIAHLAGALARPTWVLLPFAPDWRWQLAREDSPWYPSLRLFRQARPRDWSSVVSSMIAELRTWVERAPAQ
jgi:Glycosyltransferase family 9 (heptosyltransferase)